MKLATFGSTCFELGEAGAHYLLAGSLSKGRVMPDVRLSQSNEI